MRTFNRITRNRKICFINDKYNYDKYKTGIESEDEKQPKDSNEEIEERQG